jgi:ketosteroid isomerase-like protein
MSEQDNRALVQRGYDAFGRGDIETLLSLFDENIEWITPGPPEMPTAGRRRGRQQVAEFFKAVDGLSEIQHFEPHTFICEGDRVVVLGRATERVKATGKVLESEWVHVFTVRNGAVVTFQEYLDTAATVAELQAAHASR